MTRTYKTLSKWLKNLIPGDKDTIRWNTKISARIAGGPGAVASLVSTINKHSGFRSDGIALLVTELPADPTYGDYISLLLEKYDTLGVEVK